MKNSREFSEKSKDQLKTLRKNMDNFVKTPSQNSRSKHPTKKIQEKIAIKTQKSQKNTKNHAKFRKVKRKKVKTRSKTHKTGKTRQERP